MSWYNPPGWFFRRAADGALQINVLNRDVERAGEASTQLAAISIAREDWIRALAAITGKTLVEIEEFWGPATR